MAKAIQAQNLSIRKPLTQQRLKELLHYDPEAGVWTWTALAKRHGGRFNSTAGWRDKRGRLYISVDGEDYASHRLAYFYMNGAWAIGGIDHRDTNPSNDRWDNLRVANQSQNIANSKKKAGTLCSLKGASFDRARNMWRAQITKNYRVIFLGRFRSEQAAHAAYCRAAMEIFGEFARSE